MTEDATLSEFAASADDGETESDGDGPETDAAVDARSETGDSSPDAEESAAGLSTYAWGTYTCSQCDAAVDRVWRDDGGLVCPDCKSW